MIEAADDMRVTGTADLERRGAVMREAAADMCLTGTADLERRGAVMREAAADMCLTGTADLEGRPVRRAGFRAAVAVWRSRPVLRNRPMRRAVRRA